MKKKKNHLILYVKSAYQLNANVCCNQVHDNALTLTLTLVTQHQSQVGLKLKGVVFAIL